jgi:four helix bundle protein
MTPDEMQARTKAFALRVIRLTEALPQSRTGEVIGRQLLRSGTSVGANYRAVRRAKSSADFVNKLRIVLEEADESAYWMELLIESGTIGEGRLKELHKEADELTAILVASINSARGDK